METLKHSVRLNGRRIRMYSNLNNTIYFTKYSNQVFVVVVVVVVCTLTSSMIRRSRSASVAQHYPRDDSDNVSESGPDSGSDFDSDADFESKSESESESELDSDCCDDVGKILPHVDFTMLFPRIMGCDSRVRLAEDMLLCLTHMHRRIQTKGDASVELLSSYVSLLCSLDAAVIHTRERTRE